MKTSVSIRISTAFAQRLSFSGKWKRSTLASIGNLEEIPTSRTISSSTVRQNILSKNFSKGYSRYEPSDIISNRSFRNPFRPPSRLFGTKRGGEGNPPGSIAIYNEQTTLPNLDISKIERTISIIREIIDYPTYDISLILTEDEEMQQTNLETRGVDSPTDILSFPFQDVVLSPGELDEPDFDLEEYYNLGDMMLDVPYVVRGCQEDMEYFQNASASDDEIEELEYEDDDRGVSGAMAKEFDPEKRIHMLLVHGMLHLVGYDHIEDEDYEIMVKREEEVLKLLMERIDHENGEKNKE